MTEYQEGRFVPVRTPSDDKRDERRERYNALTLALSARRGDATAEEIVEAAKVFAVYLAAE